MFGRSDSPLCCVCGYFRGGTTAVTGVLALMGLPLVLARETTNLEDSELIPAIGKRDYDAACARLERLRSWPGCIVKYPGLLMHYDSLQAALRPATFIVVWRNPWSVIRSERTWADRDGIPSWVRHQTDVLLDWLTGPGRDEFVVHVEYEHLMHDYRSALTALECSLRPIYPQIQSWEAIETRFRAWLLERSGYHPQPSKLIPLIRCAHV